MDAVEILFALENEFDINIPDDEVRRCATCARCAKAWRSWSPPSPARRPVAMRRVAITGLGAICALGRNTAEFAGALRAGRSGIGPIESADISQLRFQNGAEVSGYTPPALLRRPPRRFHRPLRAVRGDRGARSRGRCGHRVDARAARDRRHRHRFLRGRPEHRRHRLPRSLQAGPQPRASADHSQDHGQRGRQPHLHGIRHHRPELHHLHRMLLGGARHRPGLLDGAQRQSPTWPSPAAARRRSASAF